MTDTNTLAPCPFCGERAETDFTPEHHSYQIECSDSIGCTARITRDSELGAIEAWNCRAALAALKHPAVKSDMLVNGGALKLALNVLRRAGKNEVADELECTAQAAPVDAAVQQDAERLDFMIESCTQVATISPSGRKYLCYPDGRMQAGSYPTARAAIDAAAQKGNHD